MPWSHILKIRTKKAVEVEHEIIRNSELMASMASSNLHNLCLNTFRKCSSNTFRTVVLEVTTNGIDSLQERINSVEQELTFFLGYKIVRTST